MSWAPAFTERGLHFYFGIGTPTRPNTFFLSQHTANPGTSGLNEASGNNYARVAVSNWTAGAVDGSISNTDAGETNLATPAAIGTVSHWGIWDSLTLGAFYCSAAYAGGSVNWDADRKLTWAVGDLVNTLRGTTARYADNMTERILQWLFNIGGVPTVPAAWHVSFHHADPGKTGANEFTSGTGGYGRSAAVTWAAGTADDGIIEVAGAGSSPVSTGAWSDGGNAQFFGLWDAATAGEFQLGGPLDTAQLISGVGQSIQWAAGGITIPLLGV